MCGVVGTVRNVNRNHQIQTLHPVGRILKVNQSDSQDAMIPVTSVENHLRVAEILNEVYLLAAVLVKWI